MRISDWSSDVCSSDLVTRPHFLAERIEVERLRRTAVYAFLDGGAERLQLHIFRNIPPHRFAHDFAGRREFARFDLAAGRRSEEGAPNDTGVLWCMGR